jgi:hypothetical protein
MTSSLTRTPLETALAAISKDTWERLRDIKAFSQRPQPFRSVRLGETTITDLAMMYLCRQGLSRSIFIQTPVTLEVLRGTDFEWWFGSAASGWFRLAVQAKKLNARTERYQSLAQRTKALVQYNTLMKYARCNGVTPVYCLYNYSGNVFPAKHCHCCTRPPNDEELGCTLTPASNIGHAIMNPRMRYFGSIHSHDNTLPWQCLASCPKVRSAFSSRNRVTLDPSFPFVSANSYYPALPDRFSPTAPSVRFDRPFQDLASNDDVAEYQVETIEFDDSLAEYYRLEAGLPRSIYITEIDF